MGFEHFHENLLPPRGHVSTFLHVTIDHATVDVARDHLVQRAVEIMPQADRDLRVNRRVRSDVFYFEAFARGVAVSVAPRSRRKRTEINLGALALAALESGGRVGLCSGRAPEELIAPTSGAFLSIESACEMIFKGAHAWWELDLGLVEFIVRRVDAKLSSPLPIAGSDLPASGFFADYSVRAKTCDEMRQVLRAAVLAEGAYAAEIPAPRVVGTAPDGTAAAERVTGRVLYP